MFTGIVERVVPVRSLRRTSSGIRLEVEAGKDMTDVKLGESIAVNGVCLTVAEIKGGGRLFFDAVHETLAKTVLDELQGGDLVNFERALRVGDRLGGHFVQGHVDGIGTVAAVTPLGEGKEMEVTVSTTLTDEMVTKGSVAVDGVSLTVSALSQGRFKVALVPFTLQNTTLGHIRPGKKINIETDLVGKWVKKLLPGAGMKDQLSIDKLQGLGYS